MNKEISKQEKIKEIVKAARGAEMESFVLGFEESGMVTTHLENIPMASMARVVIALFNQMCDIEAGQGHMSKEYRESMGDLKRDFSTMIRMHNARFEAMKNAGKGTKTSSS